jgi:branched-chain amino acid transport system substrate-binding protein
MMNAIRLSALAAALFLIGGFGIWGGDLGAQPGASIKIGGILDLTGDLAMQENALREGMEIAADEINAAGGVGGRAVALIIENSKSDSKLANAAAKKLISTDQVAAAVVATYQDIMASGALFERANIPAITLWDACPEIDGIGDYAFSIGPWIPSAGQAAAQFSFDKLKAMKVATVNTNEQWSESVTKYFKQRFVELGGEVGASFTVNPDVNDFKAIIVKLKAGDFDAIYTPLTFNLNPFYIQLRQLRFAKPVVSSDIITEENINQARDAYEGIYQTSIGDPETAGFKALEKLYDKKFKKKVTLPWFVATGYDAIRILASAMQKAGTEGAAIKDALYQIKGYQGAGRVYSFTAAGSSPDYEIMGQIRGGKFVRVR